MSLGLVGEMELGSIMNITLMLWRGRSNAFTRGGLRSFSTSAVRPSYKIDTNERVDGWANIKAIHFPHNMEVKPAPATPLAPVISEYVSPLISKIPSLTRSKFLKKELKDY